jgi:hypothetical protein
MSNLAVTEMVDTLLNTNINNVGSFMDGITQMGDDMLNDMLEVVDIRMVAIEAIIESIEEQYSRTMEDCYRICTCKEQIDILDTFCIIYWMYWMRN